MGKAGGVANDLADRPREVVNLNGGDAAQRGKVFRRHLVAAAKILNDAAVADEGLPAMFAVDMGKLCPHDSPHFFLDLGRADR